MPRSVKVSALLTFGLAILLFPFFEICKHAPALSLVNAFAEDPYDAVGSFAIQLAPFLSLLAVLRAFRPYPSEKAPDRQRVLFARAAYCSCFSVAVTLVADMIAMLRHPSLWIGVSAGYVLAALLGGMVLLTALVLWSLSRVTRPLPPLSPLQRWIKVSTFPLAGLLLLAFYPEELRQSNAGELLTIAVGALFLFGLVWALGMAIAPSLDTPFEDVIDDLVAAYQWEKAHTDPSDPSLVLDSMFEKLLTLSLVRSVLGWLNPRKHPWRIAILLGGFMGLALLLSEMNGEGGPPQLGKLAMVAAVFIGAEYGGVLLGYTLLAKPLGLFRPDSRP
jgi:hypothetical protein